MSKYDEIINLPHPVSRKHKQMSIYNRAAQFSPFAALTGYEGIISETGREVNQRIELDEYAKAEINATLLFIKDNINVNVKIIYFKEDEFKNGGSYIEIEKPIKKIDEDKNIIIFEDKDTIKIDDIVSVVII